MLLILLWFDSNKMKMARKIGTKQEENPVRCTGEGKRLKGNIRWVKRRQDGNHLVVELVGELTLHIIYIHPGYIYPIQMKTICNNNVIIIQIFKIKTVLFMY